jgi:hypothetical protein
MRMGRKGALLLLAVMVLWAVTPALACLARMAQPSCCQGTAMQDCASPAMMQCSDCCRVQPADAPLLPGSASAVDHAAGSLPSPAATELVVLPEAGEEILLAFEAPPPPGFSGAGSILRI